MKTRRTYIYIVIAVLMATFLSACGPQEIDVALTTYKITPAKDTARAGQITFHIHNDATDLTHEFVVFKTDIAEDKLPLTSEGIVDEEADGITLIDEAEDITPGTAKDLTVTLEPGNYVLVCNTDSDQMHYQHGMHKAFVVK
jgi:uncharacterized cupredoxin-like copper-binding protein